MAFVPSLTVNVLVLLFIVVPSYEAEPLPDALIDNVWVIASNSTSTEVSLVILLTVYELFETLEVTSVLFNFTLLILFPASGLNAIVAFAPSLTVKVLVLSLIVEPLYEAEPLPEAFIDNVWVIASNSTSTEVSLDILLTVYELFETLEVTSVLFTFTLLILFPASGLNIIVAFVPSLTVNVLVLLLIVVPSYEAEPLPDAFIVKI